MTEYQVIARKYRPQRFSDTVGQDPIITTLKNAIRFKRLAHAYLFSGPRGTGKTSIARIFAKAVNCPNLDENYEPCNNCPSCKEITSGSSLDVLEIDGASNRGIDEVRKMSETISYAPSHGKYKIIIVDEVHMLTKEAFNALLKTLEEPPPHAKFFFATTEPHKVLPTILSRCQRFHLNRIPLQGIIRKLQSITTDLNAKIDEDAIHLIAHVADGGLRDAESILDQMISFTDGHVHSKSVTDILGIISKEHLFALDQAGSEGNLATAFEIANSVFSQGKDIPHFVDTLIEHFRTILLIKLCGDAKNTALTKSELKRYSLSAQSYHHEQLLYILDLLSEASNQVKFSSSQQIFLELVLIKIVRSHTRVPIDRIVARLADLESSLSTPQTPQKALPPQSPPQSSPEKAPATKRILKAPPPPPPPPKTESPPALKKQTQALKKAPSHYNTLLQFSSVELEGILKIKRAIC